MSGRERTPIEVWETELAGFGDRQHLSELHERLGRLENDSRVDDEDREAAQLGYHAMLILARTIASHTAVPT